MQFDKPLLFANKNQQAGKATTLTQSRLLKSLEDENVGSIKAMTQGKTEKI